MTAPQCRTNARGVNFRSVHPLEDQYKACWKGFSSFLGAGEEQTIVAPPAPFCGVSNFGERGPKQAKQGWGKGVWG